MSRILQDALRVARFLWPKFVNRNGAILAVDFVGLNSTPVESFPSLTEAESFLNHVHVLDEFDNSASLDDEPWYDTGHPDFQAACQLGRLAAE